MFLKSEERRRSTEGKDLIKHDNGKPQGSLKRKTVDLHKLEDVMPRKWKTQKSIIQ